MEDNKDNTRLLLKDIKMPKPGDKKFVRKFKKYWDKFILSAIERDNFSSYHLKNLEILCTLYVEYDELTEVIQVEGYSFVSEGRYGVQRKTLPELTERGKILAEIRQYSRMLGILLSKDQKFNELPNEENEWV